MNQTEMTEKEAREIIKTKDDLEKLFKNAAFKKIISDGYFKDEAARIAQAITNPEMQDEVDQRSLDEMFRAIGHFNNYLLNVIQRGRETEIQLKEHEEEMLAAQKREDSTYEIDPITGDEIEVTDA